MGKLEKEKSIFGREKKRKKKKKVSLLSGAEVETAFH